MSTRKELIDSIIKVRIKGCRDIFTGVNGRTLYTDIIEFTKGSGRNTPPNFRWHKSLNAAFGREIDVKVISQGGYLLFRVINCSSAYAHHSLSLDMVDTDPKDIDLINKIEKCNFVMSL